MINLKKIVLGTAAIAIAFGGLIHQPAEAGVFKDLTSTIRKTGRRIDPINPNGYLGSDLHAKFRICNKTNNTVRYSIVAKSNSLRPGYCVKWTTTGQAVLSFDRAFTPGYQRQTYTLDDGEYLFQTVNWRKAGRGIDLKRK